VEEEGNNGLRKGTRCDKRTVKTRGKNLERAGGDGGYSERWALEVRKIREKGEVGGGGARDREGPGYSDANDASKRRRKHSGKRKIEEQTRKHGGGRLLA